MKNVKWVILAISVASFSGSIAQDQNKNNSNAGQQNVNAERASAETDNSGQQNAADSTKGNVPDTDEVAGAGRANGLANSGAAEPGSTDPRPSNTAAVPQTTSSQSGSPSILSDDDGKKRDGTNNVQRATMNMAGSPVGDVRLTEGADADTEIEKSQRQRENRPQNVSKQSEQGADTLQGRSKADRSKNEMNNNNRRENNAASDQSLDSKDSKAQNDQPQKNSKKRKRKG